MSKIAVFHFSPLEFYPPAMNVLDCLHEKLSDDDQVWVYTTRPKVNIELYVPKGRQIVIKRIAYYTLDLPATKRFTQYLRFYLLSFLQCLRFNPRKIFYYETISAFTPLLLMKFPGKRKDLFIHYHEYMTMSEYGQMKLNKAFHHIEKGIYKNAKWISHNNKYRMELFLKDLGNPPLTNTYIFPNYPPKAWASVPAEKITRPVKMIYVGSMGSLELLYIREIFEWIRSKSGEVLLDIYSFKVAEEIERYCAQMDCPYIDWKGPANYKDLPQILRQYQIGLILYKGTSANVIYSASNKLFEYLTCGLDVWYPKELIGSHEYNSVHYWPKVLPLDFTNLQQYNLEELIERKAELQRHIDYSCEEASAELIGLVNS